MTDRKILIQNLPSPLASELQALEAHLSSGNWYGAVFALKDTYETLVKYECLLLCAAIQASGDDSFCKQLLSPDKLMSFGDWLNGFLAALMKHTYMMGHPALRKHCKKVVAFYNRESVVRWRNETIGHGLMALNCDAAFQTEVQSRAAALMDLMEKQPLPDCFRIYDENGQSLDGPRNLYECSELRIRPEASFVPAIPFFLIEDGHFLMFESMDTGGVCRYTDYHSRVRVIKDLSYWREKRRKYHGQLKVGGMSRSLSEEVYGSELDEVLDGFHRSNPYEKPEYMLNWIRHCLDEYEGGLFLMRGGRGTGKSSFVYACDELEGHGTQKLMISEDAAVRAYYCSRITFSHVNDFPSYVSELLRQLPDGQRIRSRSGELPEVGDRGLSETLSFYREQYERICGKEKLLLFIDGIDELKAADQTLLECLPGKDQLPSGVYLILTCRSETEEIPPWIVSFVNGTLFTDQICFERQEENAALLQACLRKRWNFDENECRMVSEAMDHRFSALPLLEYQTKEEILHAVKQDAKALAPELAGAAYLSRLELRYGSAYFRQFLRFLLLIAEEMEVLTLSELSQLTEGSTATSKQLCFLYDCKPFLREVRTYRGSAYCVDQELYRGWLSGRYPDLLPELAEEWEKALFVSDTAVTASAVSVELSGKLDADLYRCAYLGLMYQRFSVVLEEKSVLNRIEEITVRVGPGHQLHQQQRALLGLETVIYTIIEEVRRKRFEEAYLELFLNASARVFEFCMLMGRRAEGRQLAEEIQECLEAYPECFWEKTAHLLMLAQVDSHIMIFYADQYRIPEARSYYHKAMDSLQRIKETEASETEWFAVKKIRRALLHNYLGLMRNVDYSSIRALVDEFYELITAEPVSYENAGELLMTAMCYKSGGEYGKTYQILKELCFQLEELEPPCTIREQEIYLAAYWRLCQSTNELFKEGKTSGITFAEVKIAISTMDALIQTIIDFDQNGITYFNHWRMDYLTTAALLRNVLAAYLPPGEQQEVERLKEEAYRIIEMIRSCYQNLDKVGQAYDRVSAMHNLMNCGCIYSGFGDYEKGVRMIEDTLLRYPSENDTEQRLRETLTRKAEELRIAGHSLAESATNES